MSSTHDHDVHSESGRGERAARMGDPAASDVRDQADDDATMRDRLGEQGGPAPEAYDEPTSAGPDSGLRARATTEPSDAAADYDAGIGRTDAPTSGRPDATGDRYDTDRGDMGRADMGADRGRDVGAGAGSAAADRADMAGADTSPAAGERADTDRSDTGRADTSRADMGRGDRGGDMDRADMGRGDRDRRGVDRGTVDQPRADETAAGDLAGAAGHGRPAAAADGGADGAAEPPAQLVPAQRRDEYQQRWEMLKAQFVDEPRSAVRDADELVGQVLDEIEATFRAQRGELERHWHDDSTSTEDLRLALGRYRSFFDRLLSF